jgi:drug/metabolite transporter (DMT)-like permease
VASPNTARFLILCAALLFSTGGAAIKSCDFTSWQVAALRSGIACVALLLLVPDSRRRWNLGVFTVAIAYAATLTLFVCANKLTTAANSIFLQSTAPFYVLIASPFLLKEPIRRIDVIVLLALAAGMSLFFVGSEDPSATAPDPALGNAIALCAGVTWAGTVLGLRALSRHGTGGAAAAAAALGSLLSCLFCLPFAWPLPAGDPTDWLLVGYLGVFQVGAAYALIARAMPRLPAVEVSLILMAEPAFNPLWAWLVHGEAPAGLALVGGGIILGALLVRRMCERR